MNYRHQFHAGNFADVVKHVLLIQLLRTLQKKPTPFLYLDTHAGRGRYDLERAETGDTLARKPEWPEGIGRCWAAAGDVPSPVSEYASLVREFDRQAGNLEDKPRFYPGSPWIARLVSRPADRVALCEKHPAECAALRAEFAPQKRSRLAGEAGEPRVAVHEIDGYVALRSMLPPPERRALALIDAPFEAQDEFAQIVAGLGDALRRFRTGVYAVWYPMTGRARVQEFFAALTRLDLPPTVALEVAIAGDDAPIKMKGCGLAILNPPWEFEREAEPTLHYLAEKLALAPDGGVRVEWVKAKG